MSKACDIVKAKRLMEGRDPLWIVGRVHDGTWDFQGVFSEEIAAVGACGGEDYFIAPSFLNQRLGDGSKEWEGAYFPLKVS